MSTQVYSNTKVEISWLGLDFGPGLVQGDFVTVARTTPTTSSKVSRNGDEYISVSNDMRVTITLLVSQVSDLHRELLRITNEDRIARTRRGGPMVLTDLSSGRKTTFLGAYIMSEPDEGYGMEVADISWTFNARETISELPASAQNLLAG